MEFGMMVRVRFAKDSMYVTGKPPEGTILIGGSTPLENGDTTYLRNVTEIHYNYESVLGQKYGKRIAFESDVHGTGITYSVSDIAEFETMPETSKQKNF